LEIRLHRNVAEDVESDLLLSHRDLDVLDLIMLRHQSSLPDVKTGLLVDLTDGAIQIVLILVDLSSGEAPVGTLLPSLDQHGRVHLLVQQDGTPDGDSRLVLKKLFEGAHMILD
jgi:hypothetical protein